MKISLFLIGDEIISGEREDINAHYLMKNLGEHGITLSEILITGDIEEEIINGVKFLLENSDIVITSGGLGLTPDDITIEAIAKALNREIIYDEIAEKFVKNSLERLGRSLPEKPKSEFYRKIRGAKLLENFEGVAPGELIEENGKKIFIFPGVPKEFRDLVNRYILPLISGKNKEILYESEFLINARESDVVEILRNLEENFNIKTASYPPVLKTEKYLRIKLRGKKGEIEKAEVYFKEELAKRGIKIEERIP